MTEQRDVLLQRQPLPVEHGGLAGLAGGGERGAQPRRDARIGERARDQPQFRRSALLAFAQRDQRPQSLEQAGLVRLQLAQSVRSPSIVVLAPRSTPNSVLVATDSAAAGLPVVRLPVAR